MEGLTLTGVKRTQRISEQKRWASQFTWEKVARETMRSYMNAWS
jgi:hypothetical protein